MHHIEHDLYQFSTYFPPIDLSFHQYLLTADEPILFHTGNVQQAATKCLNLNGLAKCKRL